MWSRSGSEVCAGWAAASVCVVVLSMADDDSAGCSGEACGYSVFANESVEVFVVS